MYASQKEKTRGFTLLETLIYLALYSIMMAGAIVALYALFGSSSRNQMKAMVQEEGSFLTGKIDWALTGVASISLPLANTSGNTFSVTKYDTSVGNPVVISLISSGALTLARNGTTHTLNNSNIMVTCPALGCFSHVSASGDGINPESLSASFTVHATTSEGVAYSQDFSTVKYLRK